MKLVVLDGVDGAGKTFLLDRAIDYCTKLKLKTSRFHLRPKVIRKLHTGSLALGDQSPSKYKQPLLKYIIDVIRLFMLACDYIIFTRYVLLVLRMRKTSLVFFDRYSETLILEPWRFGFNYEHRVVLLLIYLLSPKPDLRIIINADPQLIISKKEELTESQILELQIKRRAFYTKDTDIFIENNFNNFTVKRLECVLESIIA